MVHEKFQTNRKQYVVVVAAVIPEGKVLLVHVFKASCVCQQRKDR